MLNQLSCAWGYGEHRLFSPQIKNNCYVPKTLEDVLNCRSSSSYTSQFTKNRVFVAQVQCWCVEHLVLWKGVKQNSPDTHFGGRSPIHLFSIVFFPPQFHLHIRVFAGTT